MTFTLLLFWGRRVSVYAQEPEKERLIDRFSFRTNAVDWLLTIPNVSVSFDLFPGEYNKMDVLLGVRYNWNTFHKLPTYYVFDVFDARAEYRYHFRFEQLGSGEKPNFFSLKRKNPRHHIAHYVGAYANAGTFAFKVSADGRQGFQGGVGVSFGIELPLYQYKKGAIDLDLGASIGAMYNNFNLFTLNGANSAYVNNGKGWAVIPCSRSCVPPSPGAPVPCGTAILRTILKSRASGTLLTASGETLPPWTKRPSTSPAPKKKPENSPRAIPCTGLPLSTG